jgi:hypothetical protein
MPLAGGLLLAALGLAWFARAPLAGHFWFDVLPGMVLLGIGAGVAFNPLLLGAMSDASPKDSGLASGLVNTAFMMGGKRRTRAQPRLIELDHIRQSARQEAKSPEPR